MLYIIQNNGYTTFFVKFKIISCKKNYSWFGLSHSLSQSVTGVTFLYNLANNHKIRFALKLYPAQNMWLGLLQFYIYILHFTFTITVFTWSLWVKKNYFVPYWRLSLFFLSVRLSVRIFVCLKVNTCFCLSVFSSVCVFSY